MGQVEEFPSPTWVPGVATRIRGYEVRRKNTLLSAVKRDSVFMNTRWKVSGRVFCDCTCLTLSTQDMAIATVKIVFPQPAFQLLYLAHARVNMMKEGLPWLLYIWRLAFAHCQEMKRPNLHENHQFHNWPHLKPRQRECRHINRTTCHRTMSLFTV